MAPNISLSTGFSPNAFGMIFSRRRSSTNRRSSRFVVGVVLSVGGFLGIGDKWVAVPVDQIDFPTADQPARLRVEVTEEQLTNAPDFMTKEDQEAAKQAEQAQQQQPAMPQPAPAPATAQ